MLFESASDRSTVAPRRCPDCAGRPVADPDDAPASEDDDPPALSEPVRSALAHGIANTAEPTPNATANAPTRPTCFAERTAGVADMRSALSGVNHLETDTAPPELLNRGLSAFSANFYHYIGR